MGLDPSGKCKQFGGKDLRFVREGEVLPNVQTEMYCIEQTGSQSVELGVVSALDIAALSATVYRTSVYRFSLNDISTFRN